MGQRKVSHFVRPVVESSRVMLLPIGSTVKLKERQRRDSFCLVAAQWKEMDIQPVDARGTMLYCSE